MQKWSPEPFDVPTATGAAVVPGPEYIPNENVAPSETGIRAFRSEAGFNSPESIMAHLSQQERSVVFELVEQDVSREYEQREINLRSELEASHEEIFTELRHRNETWSKEFADGYDREMRDMANACASLAVALAEKIIRQHIDRDHGVLTRAIETTLFSLGQSDQLTVTVSPADAAWLEEETAVRENLQIGEVVADRRVEAGGCRITAGDREWDATLRGQLETLGKVVDEWLATSAPEPPQETDDEPPLA